MMSAPRSPGRSIFILAYGSELAVSRSYAAKCLACWEEGWKVVNNCSRPLGRLGERARQIYVGW